MSFSLPELPELCGRIAKHTEGDVSELFINIKTMIQRDSDLSFYDAWKGATEDKALFSKEVDVILSDFAKSFGTKSEEIEKEIARISEAYVDDVQSVQRVPEKKFQKAKDEIVWKKLPRDKKIEINKNKSIVHTYYSFLITIDIVPKKLFPNYRNK